jgi:hypothetical protein
MADIEFPNYLNTFIASAEAGRQNALVRAHQNALSMIGTDPAGAQNALMQAGDFQGAEAVGQVAARQQQTAARAKSTQQYAAGDLKGATNTALAGGLDQLAQSYVSLGENQRKVVAENNAKLGGTAYHLLQIKDPNERAAVARPAIQALREQGVIPPSLTDDKIDLSDQGLQTYVAQAQSVEQMIAQADKDRNFGETVRSHQATETQQAATLAETGRHNRADEGTANARLGVERERLKFDQTKNTDAVIDPATITAMAQQAWAGDKSVFANLGRGAQGAQNIAALRKEIYAQGAMNGKTPAQLAQMNAQFVGDTAASRTAGSRVGAATVSTEELPGLVQQSSEAYAKLPRTQFKPFNQLQQAVMNQTASPEQAAAYAADFAVVNAYARAVSPTGQPHVADQKKGAELLSHVSSLAEHDAVLNQIIKETEVIKAGAQRALHPDSGGSAPDAPAGKRLSPQEAAQLPPGTRFIGTDGVERVRH